MRKVTVDQTATGTFSADTTQQVAIERVGLITRINITCEVTPSATLAGANQPDGLWRVIESVTLKGGQHTYFTLPADDGSEGGALLKAINEVDGFGLGVPNGAIAAPSSLFTPINFVLHAGSRPRNVWGRDNPFDMSAFIPAYAEPQLTLDWIMAGNDVMDDAVTISAETMRLHISRVLGTKVELAEEMNLQGVPRLTGFTGMVPAWSAQSHPNAGTTTDYDAEQVDIVTGAFLSRIHYLVQDATATRTLRASDEVTAVAIKVPGTTESLYQARTYLGLLQRGPSANTEADDGAADFQVNVAYGIKTIDLRVRSKDAIKSEYGWDLRKTQNGTYKLGLLIGTRASGDDTLIVYERYLPTDVALSNV